MPIHNINNNLINMSKKVAATKKVQPVVIPKVKAINDDLDVEEMTIDELSKLIVCDTDFDSLFDKLNTIFMDYSSKISAMDTKRKNVIEKMTVLHEKHKKDGGDIEVSEDDEDDDAGFSNCDENDEQEEEEEEQPLSKSKIVPKPRVIAKTAVKPTAKVIAKTTPPVVKKTTPPIKKTTPPPTKAKPVAKKTPAKKAVPK
jgi:hypothetical protein